METRYVNSKSLDDVCVHVTGNEDNCPRKEVKIPSHRTFRTVVFVYKAMLAFYSVGLVVIALRFVTGVFSSHWLEGRDLEAETAGEETDTVHVVRNSSLIVMPILLLGLVLVVGQNVFGWMGICFLRMAYMKVDLSIQLIFWFVWLISLPVIGYTGLAFPAWQATQTSLLLFVMLSLRLENKAAE